MQLNRNYHLSCVYGVPAVKKGNIIFILECKSSGGESLIDFLVCMLCSSLSFDFTSHKTAVFLRLKRCVIITEIRSLSHFAFFPFNVLVVSDLSPSKEYYLLFAPYIFLGNLLSIF